MAPATRRTCQCPGCSSGTDGGPYQTLEGLSTQESVLKDLELHLAMVHGIGSVNSAQHVGGSGGDVRADKFPRPEISDPATDTDWQYFIESWASYKRATKIAGQTACDQLWHCPTESLKKKVFDSGIRPTMSEAEILAGIKRLAVKAHNNMINIVQFQSLGQDRDELVPQFAARLNGGAAICDFTVTCDCSKSVSYAEAMQSFQLIRGLYDQEIQEKILAEAANRDLKLQDIIKIAEAIESGKRSSGVLSKSGGLNRITQSSDKKGKFCSYCAGPWHEGSNWRQMCKGSTNTCTLCNKKGHLPNSVACKRNSKKKDKAKESNVIIAQEPLTPTPPQEGEHAGIGFFYTLEAGFNKLSHVGIDEFGKWAKVKIEDHPEVIVEIQPDVGGYLDLGVNPQPPKKCKSTNVKSLVDTGAQMVVIGINTVYAMGLARKDLIPVGMSIKAANTGGLKLLGGVLVRISGKDRHGVLRTSRQLAYVAEEVNRVFLSKTASVDLGIINDDFPIIGAYALGVTDANMSNVFNSKTDFNNEINEYKACPGLDAGKCSCPKRELPPKAPESCPYPPTPENIDRLEN